MNDEAVGGIHWSFWAIGAVGLIFNLMGCLNFVSQLDADRVASMPEAYRAIVEGRPAWATAAFAVAVFGGAVGAILLLLKKSAAFQVLIASLIGGVVAQVPLIGMAGLPAEAMIGSLFQLMVGAGLIWYAKQAESKGWIR